MSRVLYLPSNSPILSNGWCDEGRKRESVNFVGCGQLLQYVNMYPVVVFLRRFAFPILIERITIRNLEMSSAGQNRVLLGAVAAGLNR
jgi:hypothetical protein